MNPGNERLARMLREAADKVEGLPDDQWAHTITVTHDNTPSNVSATIEWDDASDDAYLETGEPIRLT